MRKIIGNAVGYTGLALLACAGIYGATQAVFYVLPVIWSIAASGDIGAIAWLVGVTGFVLLFVGALIYPDSAEERE